MRKIWRRIKGNQIPKLYEEGYIIKEKIEYSSILGDYDEFEYKKPIGKSYNDKYNTFAEEDLRRLDNIGSFEVEKDETGKMDDILTTFYYK